MTITHTQALALLAAHKAADKDDIKRVIKQTGAYSWDEKTHNFALKMGLDIRAILTAPQKQVMRAAQLINCTQAGIVGELDYTHTRILIAMRAAGEYNLTTDAIATLAANCIKPGVETRGVTRGQINTIFEFAHGFNTVLTKVSNSIGKNGYMTLTGMTQRSKGNNATITRNAMHPLALAFYKVIDGASEGQLQALADKGNKNK